MKVESELANKNIAEQITWNRLQDKFDIELVDFKTAEVENVSWQDYPDFSDAYIINVEFKDGTPLNDDEMEILHDEYSDIVYETVLESIY